MITRIVLVNGDTIAKSDNQYFLWNETGKRMELWEKKSERLLHRVRYWLRESVVWIVEDEGLEIRTVIQHEG